MTVQLLASAFDPWQTLSRYQAEPTLQHGKYGATSVFVGSMRDHNQDDALSSLFLEHYPQMTERHLARITTEATVKWGLLDCLIVHRYGDIQPADTIVLIATWSAHREAAMKACHYIIEELKLRAPFWKKETLKATGVSRWVGQRLQAPREPL